jgi:hypothetical protein
MSHIVPMRKFLIPLVVLAAALGGCSRWDDAKERAACENAYPSDKAKADECYNANKLAYDKAYMGLQRKLMNR